jgi:hypothetical protein
MTKDHILQEIRRTAEANGGVPLGSARFSSETGIRSPDWLGKYWARWGDAVREAGFAPNEFQSAFDKTYLLGKLAELARDLGRLPSANELRLRKRTDAEFPSHNAFDRLGTRSQLVSQLADHCRDRAGYEDVIRLCEQYVPPDRRTPGATSPSEGENGFVYLIKSGRHYKIGRTNSAGRREREIALQLPEKAATVHVIRTDDPCGIEDYWHKRFAEKRKNGEWFELDTADVAAFKRRKFM